MATLVGAPVRTTDRDVTGSALARRPRATERGAGPGIDDDLRPAVSPVYRVTSQTGEMLARGRAVPIVCDEDADTWFG